MPEESANQILTPYQEAMARKQARDAERLKGVREEYERRLADEEVNKVRMRNRRQRGQRNSAAKNKEK